MPYLAFLAATHGTHSMSLEETGPVAELSVRPVTPHQDQVAAVQGPTQLQVLPWEVLLETIATVEPSPERRDVHLVALATLNSVTLTEVHLGPRQHRISMMTCLGVR